MEGDTQCTGLELTLILGTTNVQATATAEDASGDTVLRYTFTADNGVDPATVVGPQASATALLELSEGSWTISVAIDDDTKCDDPPGVCSETIDITAGGLQRPFDVNQDGGLDLSDAVYVLQYLFTGGPTPEMCQDDECSCLRFAGCPDTPNLTDCEPQSLFQ